MDQGGPPDGEQLTRIEYAGLARGEDPTLARAVADLAERHQQHLDGLPIAQPMTEQKANVG